MGDVFKEQLVKKEITPKNNLIKAGIIVGAILIILISSMLIVFSIVRILFPVILLVVLGGAYFLLTMQNVEYEYVYTNGELDIDRIINKSRRKRVFSSDVRAIEIIAHIEDKNHANEFKSLEKTLDFSSGKIKPNTYVGRLSYEGKMVKLIIEPNESLQQAMLSLLSPRKFYVKK